MATMHVLVVGIHPERGNPISDEASHVVMKQLQHADGDNQDQHPFRELERCDDP